LSAQVFKNLGYPDKNHARHRLEALKGDWYSWE